MPKLTKFFRDMLQEKEQEAIEEKVAEPTILKQDAKEERLEEMHESRNRLSMNDEDKMQSIRNAIMILPPNMIVDGRHTIENISAVCGFKVTQEQWDSAYESC